MRRRAFITLLPGAGAAWPLAARAQQAERMRRIGVLMNLAADDAEGQARSAAFLQALQQLGWSDGRNVRIDYRWAAGDADRFHRYAEELLALGPDVILALATPSVQALQQATRIRRFFWCGVRSDNYRSDATLGMRDEPSRARSAPCVICVLVVVGKLARRYAISNA